MSLMEREEFGVNKIIQGLQEAVDLGDAPKRGPFGVFVRKEYLVEAIAKLRTHPDNQPNEELTEEDLWGMVGKWVWVTVHYQKPSRVLTRWTEVQAMDKYADRVARTHAALTRGIAGVLSGAGHSEDALADATNPIIEDLQEVINRYGVRCWACVYVAMEVTARTIRAQLPQDLATISDELIAHAEVTAILGPDVTKKGGG